MDHAQQVIKTFATHGARHLETEKQDLVARCLEVLMNDGTVVRSSLCSVPDGLLGIMDRDEEGLLLAACEVDKVPPWMPLLKGEWSEGRGLKMLRAELISGNATAVRQIVPYTRPQTLGLNPSFGFGDRLGSATPGHTLAAADAQGKIRPFFAQQSIREMSRTDRTANEVMDDATWGIFRTGWTLPFGADADHLKTTADVDVTVAAGFVFFTLDPSEHVDVYADDYDASLVEEKFQSLVDTDIEGATEFIKLYRDRTFGIENEDEKMEVTFDELHLKRAAVKYGRALAHIYDMAAHVKTVMGPHPFELELSVDETPQPTSPLEHLFIALELKRHGTQIVSLAPRFVGDFEKAIDYKGSIVHFEKSLRQHMAIAENFGPYKISVHSGSDKFGIYPSVGRICKGRFHVKTAGTSYLEALRVVCRVAPELFRSIIIFARNRFESDRRSYHVTARLNLVPEPVGLRDEELEKIYLEQDHGRQILHVTFGSVLTEKTDQGYRYRNRIRTILRQHQELYGDVLRNHLGKHIRMLLTE